MRTSARAGTSKRALAATPPSSSARPWARAVAAETTRAMRTSRHDMRVIQRIARDARLSSEGEHVGSPHPYADRAGVDHAGARRVGLARLPARTRTRARARGHPGGTRPARGRGPRLLRLARPRRPRRPAEPGTAVPQ